MLYVECVSRYEDTTSTPPTQSSAIMLAFPEITALTNVSSLPSEHYGDWNKEEVVGMIVNKYVWLAKLASWLMTFESA